MSEKKLSKSIEYVMNTYGDTAEDAAKRISGTSCPAESSVAVAYRDYGMLETMAVVREMWSHATVSALDIVSVHKLCKGLPRDESSALMSTLMKSTYSFLSGGYASKANMKMLVAGNLDFCWDEVERRTALVHELYREVESHGVKVDAAPALAVPQKVGSGDSPLNASASGAYHHAEYLTDKEKNENIVLSTIDSGRQEDGSLAQFKPSVHNAGRFVLDRPNWDMTRYLTDGADIAAIIAGAPDHWAENRVNQGLWKQAKVKVTGLANAVNAGCLVGDYPIDTSKGVVSMTRQYVKQYWRGMLRLRVLTEILAALSEKLDRESSTARDAEDEQWRKSDQWTTNKGASKENGQQGDKAVSTSDKYHSIRAQLNEVELEMGTLGDKPLKWRVMMNKIIARTNRFIEEPIREVPLCQIWRQEPVHTFITKGVDDPSWTKVVLEDGTVLFGYEVDVDVEDDTDCIVSILNDERKEVLRAKADAKVSAALGGVAANPYSNTDIDADLDIDDLFDI